MELPAQVRINAVCVEDIDRDGYAEVIVGCEDRYVYALNHEGQLNGDTVPSAAY